jgi:predicted transposase YbfD/YdcC
MQITIEQARRMKDSVGKLEDKRRQPKGNFRHKLVSIVVIVFTAVLCGLDDYEKIEEFGKERQEWFKKFLDMPNGAPDAITIYRILRVLEAEKLTEALNTWLFEIKTVVGKDVSIDGKTMRGSIGGKFKGVHVVSAWVQANRITLGQVVTDGHSNEITAIPKLLELIDIKGARVTIDAMGCQKEIASKIIEKGADYTLALKENQKELYRQVKETFEWKEADKWCDIPSDDTKTGYEKGHGRITMWECSLITAIDWLYQKSEWKNIKSIVKVRCHSEKMDTKNDKWLPETIEDRYYISSLALPAAEMGQIIRAHWYVENNLHWMLDVVFDEDNDQKKTGNVPLNMNVLRKAALSRILLHETKKKRSIPNYQLHALLNDDYRFHLLFDS